MQASARAPDDQAYALCAEGRFAEAVSLIEPFARRPGASHADLAAYAHALKGAGRTEDALAVNRTASERFPASGVAWHNLAATLADLERHAEAKSAIEQAMARGLDGPETWLVRAHALVGLSDVPGAEAALRETVRRQPGHPTASIELARLMWMDRADADQCSTLLRLARERGAPYLPSILTEGRILEAAGRRDALHALYEGAIRVTPGDEALWTLAAHARLIDGDYEQASALLDQALRIDPDSTQAHIELATLRLAQGRAEEALAAAQRAAELDPLDQSTWGWIATAARALGRPAYRELYDYERFVRAYDIETPPGWPNLPAFLADLAATLRRLHLYKVAPADQTLRGGTQTAVDLARSPEPVLQAFFKALDRPIRAYMAELGAGEDPLRSRNTQAYAIHSAWSVLLKPDGFHVSHFHPMGWLSSAFYVETPAAALDAGGHEGWIGFGEPPFGTAEPMPPEHWVKPAPGRLVLFPSYMWHGTVPFKTAETRMTIAFDVLPA